MVETPVPSYFTRLESDTFSQCYGCLHLGLSYCHAQCLPQPHRATGELTSYKSGILTMNPIANPQLSAPSMQFSRAGYKLFTPHS